MANQGDGEGGPPSSPASAQLIIFFIALPEPLGVPHGNTYSFNEGRKADIGQDVSGLSVQPTPNVPPVPDRDASQLFVSLKLWQVNSRQAQLDEQMIALKKVIRLFGVERGVLVMLPASPFW